MSLFLIGSLFITFFYKLFMILNSNSNRNIKLANGADSSFDQMYLKAHKLKPIVNHILRHHQGPMLKFAVQVPQLRSCPEIDEWLHLLPKDTVQDLALHVSVGAKHRLPSYLCNFRHLRNLKLDNCTFDPPLGFEGFGKLVDLDLQSVGLVPNRFGKFVACCSAIERLRLFHCTALDCLEITGPKLKLLKFNGLFSSISFKNCPLLTDVQLIFSPNFTLLEGFSLNLVVSLSSLPAIEDLHLQACALENLLRHGVPNKLTITLKSLKNLHLTDMYFEKTKRLRLLFVSSEAVPFYRGLELQLIRLQWSTLLQVSYDLKKHVSV